MKPTLHPYPSYKPAGIEWLGEVPVQWELSRGKSLFRCIDIRSKTGDEDLLTVSSEKGVVPRSSATVTMFKAESYIGYKLCWPGDLVINSLWAWAGGLGVSPYHGIISSAYGVYRLRDPYRMNPDYIHRLVRSVPFNFELRVRSKGIWISRLQLTDEGFLDAPFLVPPARAQTAIVRFLDHADRRIRRYIRAKEKLIALLEEQKQAIIQQAVTGQIDVRTGRPYPSYKDSGVEWLGEVPAHWRVWRVGHFSRVGNGSTPLRGNLAYWSEGTHPWLNSSSVNQGIITSADQFVTDVALRECHLPRVRSGSLLVGITGQGKTRGMSAVLAIEATINQHMAYITPSTAQVSSHYLHMCLIAAYSKLRAISSASGSTKGALTCEDIKRFKVVLPPLDEQERLLSAVRRELASVNSAINRARCQIDLVQEYRTRLIADVVTGKLDVREAAAALPEVDPRAEDEVDDPIHGDGVPNPEERDTVKEVTL